ncbi:hypothetical protein BKA93DRAFT_752784 [Sparassis latifolia]
MQLNDDAGTFVSVPSLLASPSAVSASSVPVVRFDNGKRSYSGVLAFSTSDHVVQGIKHIAEQLMDKGYQIKFTYKYGCQSGADTSPYGTSCDQAEKEMPTAIDTQLNSSERAHIKAHSVAPMMVSAGYAAHRRPTHNAVEVTGGTLREDLLIEVITGGQNGYLMAQYVPPHSKNRPLSRKSSAVSLKGKD